MNSFYVIIIAILSSTLTTLTATYIKYFFSEKSKLKDIKRERIRSSYWEFYDSVVEHGNMAIMKTQKEKHTAELRFFKSKLKLRLFVSQKAYEAVENWYYTVESQEKRDAMFEDLVKLSIKDINK